MRYSLLWLALCSAMAVADPVPDNFSQIKFEKRFHAADKDGDGMLSREEAYAEFPKAPDFFDEIDSNKDGRITLIEVNQAMTRRVNAAMSAGSISGKYVKPADIDLSQTSADSDSGESALFSGQTDAQHAQRYKYYESLAEDQDVSRDRSELLAPMEASPNLFNKSF